MTEILAQTARLLLRTEAEGDQTIWFDHMNSPDVMAHLGGPRTAEKIAESFARMARASADGEPSFMLLELRGDGTLIGHCGLAPINAEAAPAALRGQLQIGWTLRADHWGQGYAREAAEAVLTLAFERHGAETLFSQTSIRNVPSWQLMEKLGFQRRTDLDYVDPAYPARDNPTILYAISRDDWRAQRKDSAT